MKIFKPSTWSFPRPSSPSSDDDNACGHPTTMAALRTSAPVHPPIYDPIPLQPLHPITPAQRVHRMVKDYRGELRSTRVLQPIGTQPTCYTRTYAVHQALYKHPSTGASLLLGAPVVLGGGMDEHQPCMSKSRVVIKAVPQPAFLSGQCADNPRSEIAAMEMLMMVHKNGHPYIIPLLDCLQDEDFIYVVIPYLTGGDLFSRVEDMGGNGLPEDEARSYLRQIAEGLLFMKQKAGLAHHDVSLENVMLREKGGHQVQIIDLGMCLRVPKAEGGGRQQGRRRSPVVYVRQQRGKGKPAYVPPEVVRQEAFDPFAADVWSLGVCLYAMLVGRPLYCSPNDRSFKMMTRVGGAKQVVDIYQEEGYGLPCLSPCAKDLVCRMMHADPTKRPTLEEVLHHPFLFKGEARERSTPAATTAQ